MKHTYTYDCYYNYQQISDVLTKYQTQFPNFAKLSSLAVTLQGRNIWLMEITDLTTGDFNEKPAIFVEGNIHAGEVTGCMSVMYFLDTIFTNIDSEEIKQVLENYTIYAIPRLSPDGSEHYLTTPITVRSSPRDYMYTQDMPGLHKKDLDGDGAVRMMRVKSDYGVWKQSKLDSRLMSKRLPDDLFGEFYNLYDEGEILDYDGINIVDAPSRCGNDFNRNYPFSWETDAKQRGAGDYPLSNIETKANADFLMSHPNICFVLDMHTAGGQNLYTPGYKSRKESIKEDVSLNKTLAEMAECENSYPAVNIYDEYFPKSFEVGIYGSFCDFCHFMIGVPTIAIECWDLNVRAGIEMTYPPKDDVSDKQREEEAYKVLKWVDDNVNSEDGFMPWTPYEHPQLGSVEIGGYDFKYIRQNPPVTFLHQEVEKHTRFMHRVVKTLPKVSFDEVKVTPIQKDVYKVEATLGNKGYMPTYALKESLKNKAFKELSVEMIGDVVFIQGKKEEKIGHLGGLMHMEAMNTPVASYSKQSIT
ncbi:MAG: M14 family metallopeptidase [Erysipelotrichaceae bacterium]